MSGRTIVPDFAERVRVARLAAGMTQEDVAYKARIEQTVVSKIERGVHRPGPAVASRIAQALGIDPESVLVGGS